MGLVLIVVVLLVALGLGVFFVAMRGGPRGARNALHSGIEAPPSGG